MTRPRSLVLTALTTLALGLLATEAAAGHRAARNPTAPCQPGAHTRGIAGAAGTRCLARSGGSGTVRSDFNGDGFADLAVGVPYEDVGSVIDAGAVNVVYGSSTGLKVTGNQFWHQDSPGVTGVAQTADHFGMAIAPGDFDGDGLTDLAIGIPDESTGTVADEGGVQLLRGTRTGLVAWQYWNIRNATGNTSGLCDCRFGAALASGDFNGDGKDDLAIGMPNKDLKGHQGVFAGVYQNSGAVAVLYGSANGLSASGFALIANDNDDAPAYQRNELDVFTELDGYLGFSLAAGDYDGDGRDDLAIGEPGQGEGVHGGVWVVFGSLVGVTDRDALLHGPPYPDIGAGLLDYCLLSPCRFGWALAMGDVNGDGKQELFVGTPFDDPDGVSDAGSVYEFHSGGLKRRYTQRALPGVAAEAGDRFGWALAVGDFDRNGSPDLAIGTPNEDTTAGADAGIVTVLSSSGGVLDTQSAKTWSQASAGVPGAAEAGDRFGAALAACNLGNGLAADLAIGVPLEDFTAGGLTRSNAGVVDVLYGSRPNGLTTTGAQDWSQATTGMGGSFEESDQFGFVLAC